MSKKAKILTDILILVFSISIAYIFWKTGFFGHLLTRSQSFQILGNFTAGLFFTSFFTTAPATVALAELGSIASPWQVAAIGATGSLLGDYIIFRFVRNNLSEDLNYITQKFGMKKIFVHFRSRRLSWFSSILGAIIIASPLPDELGLALMGLSKIKTIWFILISFSLNFIGILMIALIGRSI